jgi:hypothetical protein
LAQEGLAAIFEIALLVGSTKGLKNTTGDLPLLPTRLPCPITTKIPCLGCRGTTRKSERRYLQVVFEGGVVGYLVEYVEGRGRREGGREKGEGRGRKGEGREEEPADIIDGDEEKEEN